jgi:hypothetical protein
MKFSAKYKFGSSNRLPPMAKNINVPGPGNYQSSLIDKRNAPKFGFGSSKRAKNMDSTFPGPGQYKLKGITGHEGPGVSMHTKLANLKNMETPGPGQYEANLKYKKTAPAYGQGSQRRGQS